MLVIACSFNITGLKYVEFVKFRILSNVLHEVRVVVCSIIIPDYFFGCDGNWQ